MIFKHRCISSRQYSGTCGFCLFHFDFTELIWEIKIPLRSIWSQRQTEAPWPQDPRSHLCCSSCESLCFSKSGFSRMESQILSISFLGLAKTIESAHSRRLNMTRKEMNWSVPLKAVLNLLIFTSGNREIWEPIKSSYFVEIPPLPPIKWCIWMASLWVFWFSSCLTSLSSFTPSSEVNENMHTPVKRWAHDLANGRGSVKSVINEECSSGYKHCSPRPPPCCRPLCSPADKSASVSKVSGRSLPWGFLHSLRAQLVMNPPAIQETLVWSLGWEDPLEKGKATQSSILAWRIPWSV